MGLDGVEMVYAVEDHFGITITDKEAGDVCTVADLVGLIQSRMSISTTKTCPTLEAFLTIRRFTRDFLADPDLRLRPSTSIVSIIPASKRPELWHHLLRVYGTPAPALCRPTAVRRVLSFSVCLTLSAGLAALFIGANSLWLGFAVAGFATLLLYFASSPWRVVPPSKFATFGDMTQKLVGLTHATKKTSCDDVLDDVKEIVCEILGVAPEKVVPDAHFVEDLGMG